MKASQFVFEAEWKIAVEEKQEPVTQLFCGRDFQAAFFKARNWAKENCPEGELVNFSKRQDMVI